MFLIIAFGLGFIFGSLSWLFLAAWFEWTRCRRAGNRIAASYGIAFTTKGKAQSPDIQP